MSLIISLAMFGAAGARAAAAHPQRRVLADLLRASTAWRCPGARSGRRSCRSPAASLISCWAMPPPPPPVPPVRTWPTRSPTRLSSWPAIGPGNAEPAAPLPPLPSPARSAASVVLATAQPLLSPPIMFASGTRAPSRKTSLNIARPVISRSGRISTPGWSISNAKYEMPVCFGALRVGARDQHAEVADLRGGGPHLLPGDDPLVAVALRLALQAGEVRARARLAEELAPRVLTVEDAREPVSFCSRVAVRRDRRRGEQVAEARRRSDRARLRELLVHDVGERRGCSPAEVLLGERRRGVAGLAEALPPLGDGEVGVPVRRRATARTSSRTVSAVITAMRTPSGPRGARGPSRTDGRSPRGRPGRRRDAP